ncbi:MAG: DNA polymerase IV [Thermoanaerobaculia bacterium]|nr:DNA polymerase IV [Thermoanaerobaculia bacterium]
MAPRIACLFVPLFPLAARLRSEPELRDEAVVIVEGNGTAAHVVAASKKSRKAGIQPGMTLPQARALLPKLVARSRDAACERAAEEVLTEVAGRFTPRWEDAGQGVVYLELGQAGKEDVKKREKLLGSDLIACCEKESLPARCGIAANKLAARVAAGLPESPTVIPAGEEPAFLAPLPLDRLSPEIEISAVLSRWGLSSIGDFAKLPAAEVVARLGEPGRALHESARGIGSQPFFPSVPPPLFSEGFDIDWPVVTLEPFLEFVEAALERLLKRLKAEARSCRELALEMRLDPSGSDARALSLPAPTQDLKTLKTLVKLELEARPPKAPIIGFTLSAHPDRPRMGQLTLFGPVEISPDQLATALARLAVLVGEGRIGSPDLFNGHLPEGFVTEAYDPPPAPLRPTPARSRGLLSARVLRPPVELEVLTQEKPGGFRLLSIKPLPDSKALHTDTTPRETVKPPDAKALDALRGTVLVASGPWHLEDGWWSDQPVRRAYWDLEISGGTLCRIFRDETNGCWFADGIYD